MLSLMEIIEEAFERIGADPRAGHDYRSARRSLNILLSDWSNRGLNLWSLEEAVYPVFANSPSVTVTTNNAFDIMDAAFRVTTAGTSFDLVLERMSRTDYLSIPYKNMPGTPSRYVVDRGAAGIAITLWQVPQQDASLVVNVLKAAEGVTGYQDPLSIPARFQNALVSGLAYHLAMKRAPARVADMRIIYEQDYEIAAAEDRDRSSFYLAPEVGR